MSVFLQVVHITSVEVEEGLHGQQGPLRGSSPPYGTSQRGLLDPIKLAYDQRRPDGRLKLTASAFNRLDQYAGSPGHRTYCYAELHVSSLVVVETIASTHCAYPRRDGQAELTWVDGQTPRWFASPETVTHPSTNRACC